MDNKESGSAPTAYLVDLVSNRKIPVTTPRCRVGRDDLNDIVISGDQSISRFHFIVSFENSQYLVQDAKSRHGTFLNGNQIGEPEPINDGDVLKIGVSLFWFVIEATQEGGEPTKPVDLDEKSEAEKTENEKIRAFSSTQEIDVTKAEEVAKLVAQETQKKVESKAEPTSLGQLLSPVQSPPLDSSDSKEEELISKELIKDALDKGDLEKVEAEAKAKEEEEKAKAEEEAKAKEEEEKAKAEEEAKAKEEEEKAKAEEEAKAKEEEEKAKAEEEAKAKEEEEKAKAEEEAKAKEEEEKAKAEEEAKAKEEEEKAKAEEEAKAKEEEEEKAKAEEEAKAKEEEEAKAKEEEEAKAKEEEEEKAKAEEEAKAKEEEEKAKAEEEEAKAREEEEARIKEEEEAKAKEEEEKAKAEEEARIKEEEEKAKAEEEARIKEEEEKARAEEEAKAQEEESLEENLDDNGKDGKTVEPNMTIPDWCKRYFSAELKNLNEELEELNEKIRMTQERIKEIEGQTALTKGLRNTLLTQEGDTLIDACKKVLSIVGWKVTQSEEDKQELLLEYEDEKVAIARIIWTENTAERSHLGQLSISQTRYWCEKGVEPKGVLIVAKITGEEPSEPSESTDDELVEYAGKKNVCLLSTLQLLAIYRDVSLKNNDSDDVRVEIIESQGWLDDYKIEPGDEILEEDEEQPSSQTLSSLLSA